MISIIIATFNDGWLDENRDLYSRAKVSALGQTSNDIEVILSHKDTLHEARNDGARRAKGARLVFLDADDYLDDDFCERIVEPEDVLQPMTAYVHEDFKEPANYIEPRADLLDGNHLIVGCPVKRDLFLDVGGFDDWPIYEDWALWLKMRKAGATFGKTTGIYNIQVRDAGRNAGFVGDIYNQIRSTYA